MLTICSLNKKAGGVSKYDESQTMASKLVETRDKLFKARREAFDLLFSGRIKWQGVPLGNLDYNKELTLGRDFDGEVKDAKYLPAIYRYDGRFYSMPIEHGSEAQKIWTRDDVLTKILVEYLKINEIKRIFDLTSRMDYRELIDWDIVAKTTEADVLHCFSIMGGGEDALIPFAKFMKNFALDACEEELLAIMPETVKEGVVIRDVQYTREDLPAEKLKIIRQAEKEGPSPHISAQEISSILGIGQPSDVWRGGDWLISFTSNFYKSLLRIDGKLRGRILSAIAELSRDPTKVIGDTNEPLKGRMKGIWRYRIGDYRLFHKPDVEKHIVHLLLFEPREKAYG